MTIQVGNDQRDARFDTSHFKQIEYSRAVPHSIRMKTSKRSTAVLIAAFYAFWELVLKPIWTYNVERVAAQNDLDVTVWRVGHLRDGWVYFTSYIPSSFGLGFAVGGLMFAYWDVLAKLLHPRFKRKREETGIRVWVGNMSPQFQFDDKDVASIFISIVNLGCPVKIGHIYGSASISFDPGNGSRKSVELPTPALDTNELQEKTIPSGHTAVLVIKQPMPRRVVACMPATFMWKPYPSLAFENLTIQLVAENELTPQRLRLWDSMRLSTGDREVRAVETVKWFKSGEEK